MMTSGAKHLQRLLAFALTLMLLMTTWTIPALALDDWDNLTIEVSWSGADGATQIATAVPVPDSPEHAYWVNLDPSLFNTMLNVSVIHPDPGYYFYFDDFTLSLLWDMDATSLDPLLARNVNIEYNTEFQGTFPLYFSSLPLSDDIVQGDQFTSAVTVPVHYVTEDGAELDFQTVELYPNESMTVRPSSYATEGYTLVSSDRVDVYVDGSGYANPAEVFFVYRFDEPEPTQAPDTPVDVIYQLEDGTVLDQQTLYYQPGAYTVTPNSGAVADLELASSGSVDVFVDAGFASPNPVIFTYRMPYVAPAETNILVYYYHENGDLLDMQEVRVVEGPNTITPKSAAVSGYELTSESSVNVTVYPDGSTDVASVTFLYKDVYVAPAETNILVYYYHENGSLLDMQEVRVVEGPNTITPNSAAVSGYELTSESSVNVTVYPDGSTDVPSVTFLYKDVYVAPTEATISILYQSEDYRDVAPAQTKVLPNGTHVITPAPEGLSPDYELIPGLHEQVEVVVENGVASPDMVVFYYQLKKAVPTQTLEPIEPIEPEPVKVNVTIHYYNTMGEEIASSQTVTLTPGEHELTAAPSDLPEGYELAMDATMTVTVFDDGTFSPPAEEVAFYYRPVQSKPALAEITVRYLDDRGADIASEQKIRLPDGTHPVTANPLDLPQGYVIVPGTESTVEVIVRNGVANKSTIVFYYMQHQPETFDVTVYYFDTMGKEIASSQTVSLTPGEYQFTADPAVAAAGYELMSDEVLLVKVFEDGTIEPEEVAFYYRVAQKKAAVPVTYVDTNGRIIAGPFTVELSGNQNHTIRADASRVPAAFDPDSAAPVSVYVNADGVANPPQVTLVFAAKVQETPIPVGEKIFRYGTITGNDVAFRTEASTSGGKKTIITRLDKNEKVFMLEEMYNKKGESWAHIMVDGQEGYMMSEFLSVMTQAESDRYAASLGATPVPTYTPLPTMTPPPTATPTILPTEEPTEEFVQMITPAIQTPAPTLPELPAGTPTPVPYSGYALTTRVTALRTGISSSDISIINSMEANVLLNVTTQTYDPITGEPWSIVTTLNGQSGFVQHASLRPITAEEAYPYILLWQQQNATPAPTILATNTPEPEQVQGYGVTIGDNVPLRAMHSEYSRIVDYLSRDTVVYISGQVYVDGVAWHSVQYQGNWGYIRSDLVRLMTLMEEDAYLDSLFATPEPTLVTTNQPYDETRPSSYGYVNTSSLNIREEASMDSRRIGALKRYALCLVLGSEYVNGKQWYWISYNDQVGYVHGDYFRELSVAEFRDFMESDEYRQGILNNSTSSSGGSDDIGHGGASGIVSAEDQTVNQWNDPNSGIYVSYAPFNPIATIPPIGATENPYPTLEPLPGFETQAPTNTFLPFTTATYVPPQSVDGEGDDSSGGFGWVVVPIVIGVILLIGGGVFAIVWQQQKRRKIAMRAAQRRAQAARSAERPYARQAGQPRTGTYPNQNQQYTGSYTASQQVRRPSQIKPMNDDLPTYQRTSQETAPYKPYGKTDVQQSADPFGMDLPTENAPAARSGRVGRRTAYRQAQAAKDAETGLNQKDDPFHLEDSE